MPKTSLWCVYCDNSQIDSVARCNGLRVKKKNYLAYRWSVTSWIIHDENEYPGYIIYLFTYDKIKNLSNRFFLFFFLFLYDRQGKCFLIHCWNLTLGKLDVYLMLYQEMTPWWHSIIFSVEAESISAKSCSADVSGLWMQINCLTVA